MRRRDFLTLTGAAVALPPIALAQQKLPRIAFGHLADSPPEFMQPFVQGLADYGYVDGKTIALETFVSPTTVADLQAVLAKVVAGKPDIILVIGTAMAAAAHRATTTIPIVFGGVGDPVAAGVVASLAHPGGNATGTSTANPEAVGNQLTIMKETIPTMTRLAALSQPAEGVDALTIEQVRVAAKTLNLELIVVDFVDGSDFSTQFDRVVAAAPQAVFVRSSSYFGANRDPLQDLQIKYKLPLFVTDFIWPSAMVAYGQAVITRKTGAYVGAILKGAKPQDLPVELPTAFDFIVNLKTAKAIGITIPTSILVQATQVIE